MTDRELLQMALDALNNFDKGNHGMRWQVPIIKALRARLSQPEPVAVWELQEDGWDTIADRDWMESLPIGTKLYTAPPQRELVGLTKTEFNEATNNLEDLEDCWIAIEAKLKEKNNG